ncbi:MAG: hypothetical protein AMJ79_04950 [Phycisphaerae bacterium SM23_30]|nr:MAG: hypothetical protein AMJ79_04950 [Phycisphaerae bacterium SM23_30]
MNVRKTLYLINIALVLLLGLVVVKVAWPPQKVHSSAFAPTGRKASDEAPQIPVPLSLNSKDIKNIVDNNLFSGPDPTSSPEKLEPSRPDNTAASLHPAKLELELQGTITGPAEIARANIRDIASDTIDVYRIGNIVAGARLTAIERDSVTLVRHGQTTILKVNTSSSGPDTIPHPANQLTQSSPPENTLPKLSMTLKNQILEDIFQNARIEPFIADHQPQGLRINNLEKVERAKYLPLKNGDVIRQVNGQLLTNKQKAFQVMKKARTQSFLNVELLRDGAVKTLSFPSKSNEK